MEPHRILIIDDDRDIAEIVEAAATALGWECSVTTEAATFLDQLSSSPNLIFLDLLMPETDGVELLRLLGQRQCNAGIVLMSGIGQRVIDTAEELGKAIGLDIVGHLRKPFQIGEIEEILTGNRKIQQVRGAKRSGKVAISDDDLRNAIQRDEFVLHYQPQICLKTGDVIGVEALVRWQHPELGLIYPDDFIIRLETMGLIDQLGWIVARRGLTDLVKFADANGVTPGLSINVSVLSLLDLKFPDRFVTLAFELNVPVEKITMELTESGLIKEMAKTLDVLTRLRMKRVQLSIDDFGTGYSMMRQLRHIPGTELKIDRSFVANMDSNDGDRIMVLKTIEIGHELGMRVVAEGVETAEQLELLRANHCDCVQGYFFSRPLNADDLVVWLKKYRADKSDRESDRESSRESSRNCNKEQVISVPVSPIDKL